MADGGGKVICGNYHPSGFICTLEVNHVGSHVAQDNLNKPMLKWSNNYELAKRIVEICEAEGARFIGGSYKLVIQNIQEVLDEHNCS